MSTSGGKDVVRPTVSMCGCSAHGPPVASGPPAGTPSGGVPGAAHPDAGPPAPGWGRTLSHKSLAGVQQDLTAFDDHTLDGKVFPDVLCLAHFVVHYPAGTGKPLAQEEGTPRLWPDPARKPGPRTLRACSRESRVPWVLHTLWAGMVSLRSGNPRKQVSSFPGKGNGG